MTSPLCCCDLGFVLSSFGNPRCCLRHGCSASLSHAEHDNTLLCSMVPAAMHVELYAAGLHCCSAKGSQEEEGMCSVNDNDKCVSSTVGMSKS